MATGRASPKQRVATTACTGRTRRGLDRRNLVLQVVGVGEKIGVSVCICSAMSTALHACDSSSQTELCSKCKHFLLHSSHFSSCVMMMGGMTRIGAGRKNLVQAV